MGYELYCKELFVVKHKSKYSCKSLIYFNLGSDTIKIANLLITLKKQIKLLQYLMVEMKLF